MTKIKVGILLGIVGLFLFGCNHEKQKSKINEETRTSIRKESTTDTSKKDTKAKNNITNSSSKINNETTENSAETMGNSGNILSLYSDEQIEYARVWLAISGDGILKDGNESIYVEHIAKGTPIFPDLTEEAVYDEDVIKLYTDHAVFGIIVYSSNQNGTINLYSYPSHWTSTNVDATDKKAVEEYADSVVKMTRVVSIPTGDPNKVKSVIELID